jgi:hypothetical protein
LHVLNPLARQTKRQIKAANTHRASGRWCVQKILKSFKRLKFFQAVKLDDAALFGSQRNHNGLALAGAAGKIAANQTKVKHAQ